jgi:hypothetical protein
MNIACMASRSNSNFHTTPSSDHSNRHDDDWTVTTLLDDESPEMHRIQLNKDIELVHVTVDIPAMLSWTKWKTMFQKMFGIHVGDDIKESQILRYLNQNRNNDYPFLSILKEEYLDEYLQEDSIESCPLFFYLEASTDMRNQEYRQVLNSADVIEILNSKVRPYMYNE